MKCIGSKFCFCCITERTLWTFKDTLKHSFKSFFCIFTAIWVFWNCVMLHFDCHSAGSVLRLWRFIEITVSGWNAPHRECVGFKQGLFLFTGFPTLWRNSRVIYLPRMCGEMDKDNLAQNYEEYYEFISDCALSKTTRLFQGPENSLVVGWGSMREHSAYVFILQGGKQL